MDQRYVKIISDFAKENNIPEGKGAFTLGECTVCGTISLTAVDKEAPRNFEKVVLGKDCPNCSEIHRRSPETFIWLMNVLAKLKSDVTKGATDA